MSVCAGTRRKANRTRNFRSAWSLYAAIVCALFLISAVHASDAGQADQHPVTLIAGGDVLLDRGVGVHIARRGPTYPFAGIRTTIHDAALAFINLECPLTDRLPLANKRVVFHASPSTVRSLADGGIDIVSLANNHTMDCGPAGLADTMAHLGVAGIRWCGVIPAASPTQSPPDLATMDPAPSPTIITACGVRIAFIAFCQFAPEGVAHIPGEPTIALATDNAVRDAVTVARRQADIVAVSFHWGIEYRTAPTEWQIHIAHVAAESGADLVIGHHPHVLQGAEVITTASAPIPASAQPGGTGVPPVRSVEQASLPVSPKMRCCYIFYSLGNCVFDPLPGYPTDSALLRCRLTRSGIASAEFIPIVIDRCRPRPATHAESARILSHIAGLCRRRNTRLHGGRIMPRP